MPKISRTKEMIEMPAGFVPGPQHVICAKGKEAKEHQANRLMRFMVQSNLQEYSECPTKLERSFIVSRILKTIRQDGGFVRKICNKWYDVSDRNAREKIGQLFRDSLHTQFKSSAKAKASVRRQRQGATSPTSHFSSSSSNVSSNCSIVAQPPMPTSFPITEVAFAPFVTAPTVTPCAYFGKPEVEIDLSDLSTTFDPLPLSQAMVVNFNDSIRSDDSSFQQAIDEMFHVEC